MSAPSDEHARTLAFANIALGQMRSLRHPAIPRNYELWYNYATGYHPELNQTINERLAAGRGLSVADLDQIYDAYLSPTRLTDRIDNVGAKVVDEIEQVMAMIDAAVGTTTSYTESLVGVSAKLTNASDREGLRLIVESLVRTTREMEHVNHSLESRLHASKEEITQLQANLATVRHESLTDPLTALANRKHFDQILVKAIGETEAKGEPLSLMLTDIDHFKRFNDTYGHLTGDHVLRLVAFAVGQNIKGTDLAARYGGEEFAVILPQTALRQALTVAEHIRRAVIGKELIKRSTGETLGRITISVGVAVFRKDDTPQTMIARADACLYAAKRNGRNRVICETDPEVAPGLGVQVA